jgi:hypothetical protein
MMETYNLIDLHPYKSALVVDYDLGDYLQEHSWDFDTPIDKQNFIELWELIEQYMKEESK